MAAIFFKMAAISGPQKLFFTIKFDSFDRFGWLGLKIYVFNYAEVEEEKIWKLTLFKELDDT